MALPDSLFKTLDAEEEKLFRDWARDHYDPVYLEDQIGLWHPVTRDEWARIAKERAEQETE